MVGRIGKMLRFQTKASAVRVEHAALAADCAVKKVAAVKLDSRLRCQNLQNSPARGFIDFRGRLQLSVGSVVQNPVMIVSLPEFQLLVVLIDSRADGCGLLKIEGTTGNRAQFPAGIMVESTGVNFEA